MCVCERDLKVESRYSQEDVVRREEAEVVVVEEDQCEHDGLVDGEKVDREQCLGCLACPWNYTVVANPSGTAEPGRGYLKHEDHPAEMAFETRHTDVGAATSASSVRWVSLE
jgi:hypothetical protein